MTRHGEEVARASVLVQEGEATELSVTIPPLPASERDEVAIADAPDPDTLALPPPTSSDDGPWIALGIGGGVLLVGGAIVLGVVLAQPGAMQPYDGTLGHVEIGR